MVALHESREERRTRRKEQQAKFYRKFYAEFGERIREATALFEQQRGRKVTPSELAGILRERTGKPITARCVGRWYRGLGAPQGHGRMVQLAKILRVHVGWLGYGEGERDLPSRGVYRGDDHLSFYDNEGVRIGDIKVTYPDDKLIITKCWELLNAVSPLRPALRLEPSAKSR
jgi:hypothetical protein